MATTSAQELRALLHPWHNTLRALEPQERIESLPWRCMQRHDDAHTGCATARVVRLTCTDYDHLPHASEALFLLALLKQCDPIAWRKELELLWSETVTRCWFEPDADGGRETNAHAQVQLACEFVLDMHDEFASLTDWLTCAPPRSAEYSGARKRLEDAIWSRSVANSYLQHQHQQYPSPTVPVVVKIVENECGDEDDALALMFAEMEEFMETQHTRGAVNANADAAHALVICGVDIQSGESISIESFRCMVKMVQYGVVFNNLTELEMDEADAASALVVKGLHAMVGVSGRERGATTLVIAGATHLMPLIFSAVQESQSLRELDINLGCPYVTTDHKMVVDDQAHSWQWLAFALFSNYRNHTIKKIKVNSEHLRIPIVVAMGNILDATAANPMALLFGHDGNTMSQPPMRVLASQFHLRDPEQENDDDLEPSGRAVVVMEEPMAVLMIDAAGSDDEWLSVLLPGRGKAWVRKCDATVVPLETSSKKQHAIEEIVVTGLSDLSVDAASHFFQLVGQSVKSIHVQGLHGVRKIDTWCAQVLKACPKLEILQLYSVPIGNMQVFTDGIASADCQLKTLALFNVGLDQDRAGRQVFFEALTTPSHPLAWHLETLELNFPIRLFLEPDGMRNVLELNKRLKTLHFHVQFTSPSTYADGLNQRAYLRSSFEKYHGEQLVGFGISHKVAFLSVLTTYTSICSSSVCQLGSDLVGTIFQFAAEFTLRNVEFTEY